MAVPFARRRRSHWLTVGIASLIGCVITGCAGAHSSTGSAGSTPRSRAGVASRPAATAATAPSRTTVRPTASRTTSAAAAAVSAPGGPVPSGFAAADYSFVSDTLGWVLGTAPCSRPPCTSLVRTQDGGRTFVGVPAPKVALTYPCAKPCGPHAWANQVRFADPRDGWAYGSVLYVTHDGARTWHQVPGFQDVVAVLPGASDVIVLSTDYSSGCTPGVCPLAAARAPTGNDRFIRLSLPSFYANQLGWPARQGHQIWLLIGGSRANTLLRSNDDGSHWITYTVPCQLSNLGASDLQATPDGTIWTVCSQQSSTAQPPGYLLVSPDGGATWKLPTAIPHGRNPRQGVLGIAAATASRGYATIGDGQVVRTDDAGGHWQPSLTSSSPVESLGVEDAMTAHALAAAPATGMWSTTDGGMHWQMHAIR